MLNQVAITRKGGKELTQSEITTILHALGKARTKLPPITYEYRPPVRFISQRETLYILPEQVENADFLYLQIQTVLEQNSLGEYVAEAL